MDPFDLKLLQAINDWQKGGAHAKKSRGKRLKKLAIDLEARFRTTAQPCYRRIDLEEPGLQLLGETLRLPETISAWTLSPDVAMGHNHGVPPAGEKVGIIIRLAPVPPPGCVIINLDALFTDPAFHASVNTYRDQIKQYDRGMGRYGGDQREVVIEVSEVLLSDVWAWGGHSSTKEELLRGIRAGRYGAANATPEAIDTVRRGLEAQPEHLGPQWLTGPDAVQRTRATLERDAKAKTARTRATGR